jgi:hypothetical protein
MRAAESGWVSPVCTENQILVFGTHTPIDSSIDTHQIWGMRRSSVRRERCAHTTKNRTEVLCPRVIQAAMIAAASFGLRRSGRFATATSGAAYWAASVRHGPPWPLPVNAPKSIFQNSIRAANSAVHCRVSPIPKAVLERALVAITRRALSHLKLEILHIIDRAHHEVPNGAGHSGAG